MLVVVRAGAVGGHNPKSIVDLKVCWRDKRFQPRKDLVLPTLLKKWRKFVLDRDLQIRVSGFYHWNELTRSVLSDKLSEDEVPVLNDGLIRVKQVQRAT